MPDRRRVSRGASRRDAPRRSIRGGRGTRPAGLIPPLGRPSGGARRRSPRPGWPRAPRPRQGAGSCSSCPTPSPNRSCRSGRLGAGRRPCAWGGCGRGGRWLGRGHGQLGVAERAVPEQRRAVLRRLVHPAAELVGPVGVQLRVVVEDVVRRLVVDEASASRRGLCVRALGVRLRPLVERTTGRTAGSSSSCRSSRRSARSGRSRAATSGRGRRPSPTCRCRSCRPAYRRSGRSRPRSACLPR